MFCMTKAFCRGKDWGIWPHFYPTQLTLFIDSDTGTHIHGGSREVKWENWGAFFQAPGHPCTIIPLKGGPFYLT